MNSQMKYGNYGVPVQNGYSQYPAGQPEMNSIPFNVNNEIRNCNCDFINVPGPEQVKECIVRPGQKIYFIDNNRPLMYTKEANNFGTTETKAYTVQEIDFEELMRQVNNDSNGNPVSREEFAMLIDKIKSNDELIASLSEKIDNLNAPKHNNSNNRRNNHESVNKQGK